MRTLLLQLAAAVLTLGFGILAARVVHRLGAGRRDRQVVAWRIAAAYFLVAGAYALLHGLLGALAVRAGPSSALLHRVVEWGPSANVARALSATVFAGLVLYTQLRPLERIGSPSRSAGRLLLAVAVGGTLVAHVVGPAALPPLATSLAVLATLGALLLLSALLLALARDGMDGVLWLALTAYTLKEVLSVSLFSIFAWWDLADARSAVHMLYSISVVVLAGMCGAAAWRLRLAGAGRPVRALFERVRTPRPPTVSWDQRP